MVIERAGARSRTTKFVIIEDSNLITNQAVVATTSLISSTATSHPVAKQPRDMVCGQCRTPSAEMIRPQ
jgi:hypothetical protein